MIRIYNYNIHSNILYRPIKNVHIQHRYFARSSKKSLRVTPPPPTTNYDDVWQEVKDSTSGQSYWWNTVSNETTPLGAPKPISTSMLQTQQPNNIAPPAQQGGSMIGGLGQTGNRVNNDIIQFNIVNSSLY